MFVLLVGVRLSTVPNKNIFPQETPALVFDLFVFAVFYWSKSCKYLLRIILLRVFHVFPTGSYRSTVSSHLVSSHLRKAMFLHTIVMTIWPSKNVDLIFICHRFEWKPRAFHWTDRMPSESVCEEATIKSFIIQWICRHFVETNLQSKLHYAYIYKPAVFWIIALPAAQWIDIITYASEH